LTTRLARNYTPSFRRSGFGRFQRGLILEKSPGRLVIGQGGDETWG